MFKSDEVVYSQSNFTPFCYHPETKNLYAEHLPQRPEAGLLADTPEEGKLEQTGAPTGKKKRVGFTT